MSNFMYYVLTLGEVLTKRDVCGAWMCSEIKDAVSRGLRDQPHAASFLETDPEERGPAPGDH